MKVYKFGGASVNSAEGVRNLTSIISGEENPLLIIVSAMGKTTNALEKVVSAFTDGSREEAVAILRESINYHRGITEDLFGNAFGPSEALFAELSVLIQTADSGTKSYDEWYDSIVSYGEMISTSIVSGYLETAGLPNRLLDMRKLFITDGRHRDADIDLDASAPLLMKAVGQGCGNMPEEYDGECRLFIAQGFIGGSWDGHTVTLGREGSDYSAAAAAYILDAESLTIWKDVEGILNADPKFFEDTSFIPELTYLDAIELSYSGAQVIHPKTIKPLQNKDIPLYVRPFGDKTKPGSVITGEMSGRIEVPVLILKHDQVLISIRPNDFSFVLGDVLPRIFTILHDNKAKINLIQSSAVNLSVSIDRIRELNRLVRELKKENLRVLYNDSLELLTVRGYTPEIYGKLANSPGILIAQKTRRILRIVRKAGS